MELPSRILYVMLVSVPRQIPLHASWPFPNSPHNQLLLTLIRYHQSYRSNVRYHTQVVNRLSSNYWVCVYVHVCVLVGSEVYWLFESCCMCVCYPLHSTGESLMASVQPASYPPPPINFTLESICQDYWRDQGGWAHSLTHTWSWISTHSDLLTLWSYKFKISIKLQHLDTNNSSL